MATPPDDEDPDKSVLSPEDLDITAGEEVRELDETRFVVMMGEYETSDPEDPAAGGESPDDPTQHTPSDQSSPEPTQTESIASDIYRLVSLVHETDSQYAYDLLVCVDSTVMQQRIATDDVVVAFESLVKWYVDQLSGQKDIDRALAVLLAESEFEILPLPGRLEPVLARYNLKPTDRIQDLLDAIEDNR